MFLDEQVSRLIYEFKSKLYQLAKTTSTQTFPNLF